LALSYSFLLSSAHHLGACMEIIIIILLILVIALSAVMLYREFQRVSERMGKLEERVHRAALNREKEERQLGISFIENAEAWLDQVMAEGTKRDEQK
jgi:predicted Holliday junction resolvase-like endonuclease